MKDFKIIFKNVPDMVVSCNHSPRRDFTRAKEYIMPLDTLIMRITELLCDIEERPMN